MKVLRVDMTDKRIRVEDVPQEYAWLGGRGLTSIMINNEVIDKNSLLNIEIRSNSRLCSITG